MILVDMTNTSKALILLALLVTIPAAAVGQAGYIGLYADAGGTECFVSDRGPGQAQVYVVHQASAGATASQWKIVSGDGLGLTWLSESWSTVAMGDTRAGVTASYGGCETSPMLLCTITYTTNGTSSDCSYLEVVPDPSSFTGAIEVVDCASQQLAGRGGKIYVNPTESCPCGLPNPVEHTDWGRIKAMFAE